jgi:hypothetical protein
MNLRNEFNRLGHILHNGVDKTQQATEGLTGRGARQARGMAKRMRNQVDLRSLATTEEKLVQHVRDNPALYLIGAALIIGALVAKLLLQSSAHLDESRRIPLL